jgi:hypothetical protein
MKYLVAAAFLAVGTLLAGCQTMQPASYSNYGDNTFTLRKLAGAKVRVASINDLSKFDSGCRMVGPIKTAGNRPLAEFVRDSLNDEFKFAGIYSDNPGTTELSATLNSGEFSSMSALTQGYWSFSLQLANQATGKSLTAASRYNFDSGFDAATACMNTSNALTPAVQRLIYKAVSDSEFGALLGSQQNADAAVRSTPIAATVTGDAVHATQGICTREQAAQARIARTNGYTGGPKCD